jgi:hypothetical protein
LVVGSETLPRFAQQLEVLHVARVARFRSVDRDDDDVVDVRFVMDRHGDTLLMAR